MSTSTIDFSLSLWPPLYTLPRPGFAQLSRPELIQCPSWLWWDPLWWSIAGALKDACRFFSSSLIVFSILHSTVPIQVLSFSSWIYYKFPCIWLIGYRIIHGECSDFLWIVSHLFLLPFCLRKTIFYLVFKPTPSVLKWHLFTYFVTWLIIPCPFLFISLLKILPFDIFSLAYTHIQIEWSVMKCSFPLRLSSFLLLIAALQNSSG